MPDYILFRKSRNVASSVLHVFFNLALGVLSIAVTYLTKSWYLGIILVLISKWRMFLVRPRYWVLNLKSNLVDLIVGISFVLITYCSGDSFLPIHVILAVLYCAWLIFLKPRSSTVATALQALTAMYLGTTCATLIFANADAIFLTASCAVVAFASARHVLVQSDDTDFSIIPLTAALVAAEISWLSQSWLIVYSFPTLGIIVPQLSLVMLIAAVAFGYIYKSIKENEGRLNFGEVAMLVFFSIILIAVIVLGFSKPIFNV
ncbi:MAG: hypothetical protein Q4E47_00620 [Candidatus Saccharibacteria bacterium]|nr:hypothetical protein [Candidatus Saccharibacteria bacterium]